MDPAEIRLIRLIFIKESVTEAFKNKEHIAHLSIAERSSFWGAFTIVNCCIIGM